MRKRVKISFTGIAVFTFLMLCSLVCSLQGQAKGQTNWQSIYADEMDQETFIHAIPYGKLSIARCQKTIHIMSASPEVKFTITSAFSYGGALTNGSELMYQQGKTVYLWKEDGTTTILFSLPTENDILVARYGNVIYFGREVDGDAYRTYSYNLKTNKIKKLKFYNTYYCNGKYMFVGGQFHEGVTTPVKMYNMKTGKITTLSKKGSYANAAIIENGNVYYVELNEKEWVFKITRMNLKTKKKKVMAKDIPQKPELIDSTTYVYTNGQMEVGGNIYWGHM